MNSHNEVRTGLAPQSIVRAALAALAIVTLASVPSADAQRRPAAQPAAARAQADESAASDAQGTVNIQTASVEELQRLPGIGPSKAAAIVAHRERSAFRRVEDILRVRGIGRATFRRLRPMLTVSGPTTLTEQSRARRPARAESDEAEIDAESGAN